MTAPDKDAQCDMETALCTIHGIADVMARIGKQDNAVSYLGGELRDAYEALHDAFCRAYKLDEYREERADGGAA